MRTRRPTRNNLVADLTALRAPVAIARAEAQRATSLAHAIRAGRMTLEEAVALHWGVA